MPCGTGKSLMAYWIARGEGSNRNTCLPSLALVKQSFWTSAEGIMPKWVAVCSDDDVGKLKEADSTVATVYEAGIPVTTDPQEITNFVEEKFDGPKIIFTTYQSSPV